MPKRTDIAFNELASIFFNLLDNAIEACQKITENARFTRLKTKYVRRILSIHMENSNNTKIIFKKQTTKADILSHGFDLSIIEDIVLAHNGSYNWLNYSSTFFQSDLAGG